MQYETIQRATFIKRPNRFIAHVLLNGQEEKVHVKNTGRCKEILKEGSTVILEKAKNKNRKTKYSLIAAYKNDLLINIDSQVPNQVVFEAIETGKLPEINRLGKNKNFTILKREVTYGNSRFDIYFEKEAKKGFVEVKGVTLENNGKVMFPDAPTTRGTKHLMEMIEAVKEGYLGYIFFLIQLKGANYFTPNQKTDPKFTEALKLAKENDVEILAYDCHVTEDTIDLGDQIPIRLWKIIIITNNKTPRPQPRGLSKYFKL